MLAVSDGEAFRAGIYVGLALLGWLYLYITSKKGT
jgi:hypothetical protein